MLFFRGRRLQRHRNRLGVHGLSLIANVNGPELLGIAHVVVDRMPRPLPLSHHLGLVVDCRHVGGDVSTRAALPGAVTASAAASAVGLSCASAGN